MKKLILLILVSCASFAGFSQVQRKISKDSTTASAAFSKKKALNNSGLNAEQKSKIKELRAQAKASRQAILDDQSLTAEQKHAKLAAIKKENAIKINALLTDEQKQKLKDMKKNHAASASMEKE